MCILCYCYTTQSLCIFVTAPLKTNMAAVSGYLHLQYSSKDIFTISLLQVASAWTAVAVSNYTLPHVSLISNTARSLRIFCLVFSLLSFTLLRFKSKVKFTVSCFDLDLILSVLNWVFFVEVEISRVKFTSVLTLINYLLNCPTAADRCMWHSQKLHVDRNRSSES